MAILLKMLLILVYLLLIIKNNFLIFYLIWGFGFGRVFWDKSFCVAVMCVLLAGLAATYRLCLVYKRRLTACPGLSYSEPIPGIYRLESGYISWVS